MVLSAVDYRPRDAEPGVLYRVIDEHLDAFLDAAVHHADGSRLPKVSGGFQRLQKFP